MGDRGNIVVVLPENERPVGSNGEIWFYTHWRGSDIKAILATSLKRGKDRWDDPAYLNRIIFADLTRGHESDVVGYGISLVEQDNEHEILYVHHQSKTVSIGKDAERIPYEAFIASYLVTV